MQLHDVSNQRGQWGWVTITIHWITAITVIGLFALGLWMVELDYYDEWNKRGPELHKSIGISLFLLTLVRILWRFKNVAPTALPTHQLWERKVAGAVHLLLYLLLLMVMISGYLISTADGRVIVVFGLFEIPATLYGMTQQGDIAGTIHLVLASMLVSTIPEPMLA